METQHVKTYLEALQTRIVDALSELDGKAFKRDLWTRPQGGGGKGAGHTRHHLIADPKAIEGGHLLLDGAVYGRVAGVEANRFLPGGNRLGRSHRADLVVLVAAGRGATYVNVALLIDCPIKFDTFTATAPGTVVSGDVTVIDVGVIAETVAASSPNATVDDDTKPVPLTTTVSPPTVEPDTTSRPDTTGATTAYVKSSPEPVATLARPVVVTVTSTLPGVTVAGDVARTCVADSTDTDVAALRWAVPLRVALVTSTVVGVLIAVGRPAEALTMGIGALVTGVADQRGPVAGRIKSMTFMAIGVAVAVTIVINMGRAKYAWVPFIPLCFVAVSTLTAGYRSEEHTSELQSH